MINSENIPQDVDVNNIQPLIETLSTKDLQELFIDISQKFNSKLDDGRQINELKRLQTYLRMIASEINSREKSNRELSTK
jgi:hypothetical protein